MENREFFEIKSATAVLGVLENFSSDTIIFLDVDDTLITPVSNTFRASPYNQLIDEIKHNKHLYPNFEEIVSNWRLQRKAMLLDEKWPEIIDQLKEKFDVYGLTKMDVGKFGNIESMEKWRINELQSFGITFSSNAGIPESEINDASFYRGMFMTGSNTKGKTLSYYLHYFFGKNIVLVDDRLEHLIDIRNLCQSHSIDFTGIIFQGLAELKGLPDPNVAALQKKYLIEYAQWLEDNEALSILKKNEL